MQSLTQTVLDVAAATLRLIRREALAPDYGGVGPHNRSYVGLHTPDTDPLWVSRQAEPGGKNLARPASNWSARHVLEH